MRKFTPGKWKYVENGNGINSVVDERGVIIADFYRNGIKNPEANARLTACAPELYEAVILLNNAMKATGTFLKVSGYDPSDARMITRKIDELIRRIDGKED